MIALRHPCCLATALLLTAGCRRDAGPGQTRLGPAPRPPVQRVVTLAPSLTELAIALGAAARVVGVTRFDDDPAVADAARVGGYSDPSPEAVVRLSPDLVLVQPAPGNRGAVRLIADAGIPVQVLPLSTLREVTDGARLLGALLGREEAAERLVGEIERARSQARAAAQARGRRVRAVLVVGVDPLVVAGPSSWGGELLADAGAENVALPSAQPFPRVSPEHLLARAPDVVLLAPAPHGDAKGLPPELTRRVVALRSEGVLRPGPRVVEALAELSRVLDGAAADGGAP